MKNGFGAMGEVLRGLTVIVVLPFASVLNVNLARCFGIFQSTDD